MAPEVGSEAPDFTVKDQNMQDVTLSSFRGERSVLIVFYPFAFSGICTGELCQLRDELTTYTDAGVTVLAISTDPVFSLKAFREQEGLGFRLLSDFWPHGAVAQAYGVFNEAAGRAVRGTFVIDKDGTVRWKVVNEIPNARDHAEYAKVLAELG